MQPTFDRRTLLLAAAAAAAMPASAKKSTTPAASTGDELELWPDVPSRARVTAREEIEDLAPGAVPRDRVVWHVTRPLMTLFRPEGAFNGITMLVIPGGGYRRVVLDREGLDTAAWLASHGFAAAALRYRLPADGWDAGPDAPMHDAMRAMRLLRAHSQTKGARPARVGVVGFSAGGHLAARLITEPALAYPRADAADDLSALPDFAVLLYPVIALTGAFAHPGSAQQFIAAGVPSTDEALARYSAHLRVTAATPPTQLIHAADDNTVPVENSLLMYDALRRAGVRSELHLFDAGGHGFGLRGIAGKNVAVWPNLMQTWALSHATRN